MLHFAPSRALLKPVNHVQFGILSPEETIALSVARIEHVDTFDRNGGRKLGGLLDPRMGCADKLDRCATCRSGTEGCPGHFGHIELARPLYHVGWQMIRVKKILETVCRYCSRVRLTPTATQFNKGVEVEVPREKYNEMLKLRKTARFQFAWRYGKSRGVCEWPDCRRQLLALKKVRTKLQYDNGSTLEATEAHSILRRISDADWTLLGMDCVNARPEWMILTVLPVPPPAVRPSINMEGNGRGEDDLTHKLSDIIKFNELVKNPTDGSTSKTALEHIELLQYHVTTYIDNDIRGNDAATQKGGRPLRSLKSRLKGKEGRLRNNLMGKRVDFSARTVITGDPELDVHQVGVPKSIARNLTFPEIACAINIEKLQRLVDNRGVYPGAKYLIHDGRRRDLRFGAAKTTVQMGDTVERHIVDDDIVVFNRQPSLHKMSMMGHKVRVMPYSTFRLNLSVTTPYNADFDGDEMNLHVPQCFPVDETRVLTNHGFLFYDQLSALLNRGEMVTYACYEVASDTLVFRAGKVVEPYLHPSGTLIDFTHEDEACAWNDLGDPYGLNANGRHSGGHLSLRVTPNHDMWLQVGDAVEDLPPPGKHRAEELAKLSHTYLRFDACAAGGVGENENATVVALLTKQFELKSEEQVAAFLELFGFWLGDGSLDTHDRCVVIQTKNAGWVRQRLAASGVAPAEWSETHHQFCVRRRSWFAALHALYGKHRSDKWFPPWTQLCSKEQLRSVVRGLDRAAGKQQHQICTCSIRLRDELLAVLVRAGYSTYFTPAVTGYSHSIDAWMVSYAESTLACHPTMQRKHVKTVAYSGRVWCVTVEHADHLIVAQRALRMCGRVTKASKPIIVGQSLQTRAEILHLTMVPDLVVSPQSNRPVCGIVQDALLGTYLLTSRDTFLDREAMMDLVMHLPGKEYQVPPPAIVKPKSLWTGKQLFSMLLPKSLSYSGYHSAHPEGERLDCSPGDTKVVISQGQHLCGIICKRSIGPTGGGLIHLLWMDEGSTAVQAFMNGCQRIANQFLVRSSFSVAVGDGLISSAGMTNVTKTVVGPRQSGDDNMTRDSAGKLAQSALSCKNNFRRMVAAGSKGSSINISQIAACVGPQNVEGKGIPRGFRDRTLPHFQPLDSSPSARGFVMNSYSRGLNPSEFFFHAMGGREGIIDTAVKSVTGDTRIVIIEEGTSRTVAIGEWIDAHLAANSSSVQHHSARRLELLTLTSPVCIPTMDASGRVSWGTIAAVTRHDPGDLLYCVETASGCKVTVTESKSLLIWDVESASFVETDTPLIKVGDHLPLTDRLPAPPPSDSSPSLADGFQMNYANGQLVGLFLACGSIKDGTVRFSSITAYDKRVLRKSLEILGVAHVWSDDCAAEHSVDAMSYWLAGILERLDGHIPDCAFAGPEDFVRGMLWKLSSAKRTMVRSTKGINRPISLGCTSPDAIHMLISRLSFPRSFHELTRNDVFLDAIVKITTTRPTPQQKVYDLTVPETFNFGLANGLHVRDTAETGYLQRKLVKALEDAMVGYDTVVRNGRGNVIQWAYGEDGMDGTAIEKQSLVTLLRTNAEIAEEFAGDQGDELQQLITDRNNLRTLIPSMQDSIALPANMKRIVLQAEARHPGRPVGQKAARERVNALLSELIDLGLSYDSIFAMHIRSVLASRQLSRSRISESALDWIHAQVIKKYRRGLVHPGEMVGVIAAQSIGEPATQLTLNTFHLAGIGSKKLTLGIPRLKELLNTSQNIRTPSMTLSTVPGYLDDYNKEHQRARLRFLKSEIEHVSLDKVVKTIQIINDGGFVNGTTTVDADRQWVELFLSIPDDTNPDWTQISPWMFRIVLDRARVWEHCLTMRVMVNAIMRDTGDDAWCIWSDDNDPELVIHFHLVSSTDSEGPDQPDVMPMDTYLRQLQDQLLVGVTLKGVRGISGVSLESVTVPTSRADGSIEYVKETVIETEGINIGGVSALPEIDGLRVTCNNPVEILQFLGIEAARAVLLKEIRKVIEFDGSYINVRHLMLLCDVMTNSGSLMAITRHGINRTDAGPLAKSSFEETNDILFSAAADSDRDTMQGVSESLIFGQMARLGTGSFDVIERWQSI